MSVNSSIDILPDMSESAVRNRLLISSFAIPHLIVRTVRPVRLDCYVGNLEYLRVGGAHCRSLLHAFAWKIQDVGIKHFV